MKRSLLRIFLCLATAPLASPAQTTEPAGKVSTTQLIDRLQDVSDNDFAVRTNIIAMGEKGDQPMPTALLKLQDPAPKPAEAIEELTRRGLNALPDLIRHLADARKSKVVVEGITDITYSDEFDRNPHTEHQSPSGTSNYGDYCDWVSGHQTVIVGQHAANRYTLAVGDLCFNVIGKIVNRKFDVVRSIPSGVVIVNSPVLCPDVRNAVDTEWGHLTLAEHRKSLLSDVTDPDEPARAVDGASIILRYYPDLSVKSGASLH